VLEVARKEAERERKSREAMENENEGGNPLAGGRNQAGGPEDDPTMGGKRRPVGQQLMTREAGVVPQGDELLKALSCAVVLATAPSVKQFEVYEGALEKAAGYNPARDVPQYLGYFVERSEVIDDKQGPWVKVPVTDGQGLPNMRFPFVKPSYLEKITRDWASSQEDPMDMRYSDYALTTPLPPLVGAGWGNEIVHSLVPLQADSDAEAELKAKEDEEKLEDADDGGEGFDVDNGVGGPGMGGMAGAEGRRGGMRGMGPEMGGMRGGGMPGMGGMRGGMPGMGGGNRGGGGMGRSSGPSEFDIDIPVKMVRFFDFTVQPGRQYRYRVRLVLADVNQAPGVERRYLAREVAERIDAQKEPRPIRLAPWSDPSPVISIPMAGSVSIVDAKPPKKGSTAEGLVNVLVQSYALDAEGRAQQAGIKKPVRRGGVMNMVEDAEVITPDRQFIEKVPDFQFQTGITLADFRGGEEVARGLKRPVQALYMDAGGRLFVRHELDDAQTVEDYEATFEAEEGAEGGMMMPGMGMPGMRGMRGPMGGTGRER
jgi:hypothetical protein